MVFEKLGLCRKTRLPLILPLILLGIVLLGMVSLSGRLTMVSSATAQEESLSGEDADLEREAEAEARRAERKSNELKTKEKKAAQKARRDKPELSLVELAVGGGWLMVPIVIMSVMVILFGIERALGLRRSKVIPNEMVNAFGQLAKSQGGFDPQRAYRLCQQFPCSASNVIRSMILKVGRPHSEVENAVSDANEREAAELYSNVRPLNLAAAVTPLIGLLGTVVGMIMAFFATANLEVGQNKADALAEGIYVALVTTCAGLIVAIPAAVLAHYFEGRIQSLFRDVDDLLSSLLPQVERYEGKLRVNRAHLGKSESAPKPAAHESTPAPVATPAPATD